MLLLAYQRKWLLQIEGRVKQIEEGGIGQGLAQPSAFAEPTRTKKGALEQFEQALS